MGGYSEELFGELVKVHETFTRGVFWSGTGDHNCTDQDRLHIHTAAGDKLESCADDVTALRTAHDAWVIGDETVVLIDWSGAADFAREAPIQPSVGPRDSRGGVVTTQE